MEKVNNYWHSYEMMTWEYDNEQDQESHCESLNIEDWKLFGKPHKCVSVYQRPMITIHDMYFRSEKAKLEQLNQSGELVDNYSYIYEIITWNYESKEEQEKHCKSIKVDSWQLLDKTELTSIYQRPFREMMHYKRENRKYKHGGVSLW